MKERFQLADRAVLATVVAIGPAQWNTPDGKFPEDWTEAGPRDVIRLVQFSTSQVWKGDLSDSFVAAVQGGLIGCWNFVPDPAEVPEIVVGQEFALFLLGSPKPEGLGDVHNILTILPLDEQGRIVTPEEGRLTPDEMAGQAAAAAAE